MKPQDAGLDGPTEQDAPRDIQGTRIRVGDRLALATPSGFCAPELIVRRVLEIDETGDIRLPDIEGDSRVWIPEHAARSCALVLS